MEVHNPKVLAPIDTELIERHTLEGMFPPPKEINMNWRQSFIKYLLKGKLSQEKSYSIIFDNKNYLMLLLMALYTCDHMITCGYII